MPLRQAGFEKQAVVWSLHLNIGTGDACRWHRTRVAGGGGGGGALPWDWAHNANSGNGMMLGWPCPAGARR